MPEATLIAIVTTSFLVGLSGAMSPGPLLAFDLRESLRIGFWAGPLVSLGHALLELLTVVLLALGLTHLFSQEAALTVVGIPGGAFLLWMAWGMVRHPARGLPEGCRLSLPAPQLSAPPALRGGSAGQPRQSLLDPLVAHCRGHVSRVGPGLGGRRAGRLLRGPHPLRPLLVHPGVGGDRLRATAVDPHAVPGIHGGVWRLPGRDGRVVPVDWPGSGGVKGHSPALTGTPAP